ncbi:MAG: Asp-tRNA(Asn)/Glu-tRNA(Gln) amidotransferase subunit GatB [Phycisphaerales bacterium]
MPPATAASIVRTTLKVGLEIHVELATRTKMFTRVANPAHPEHFDREPNSLVDPVVAALPGTLPVMNRRAVEMSMMVGLALGCRIAEFSKWDRKNYYYPDLPKGYQISQYDLPLCADGAFELRDAAGTTRRIGIIRAHLEEDTGKLGHELPGGARYDGSLVDLNRAGTPLLEIVTAPDFDDVELLVSFAQELRSLCTFLGVSEGIMQKGHMRFEPNVNVLLELQDGRRVATPVVEIKNLNSFKALRAAVMHELERQPRAWLEDGREMGRGMKSTRGWDDVRGVTVLQREKEDAHDYRYFPDPDLLPVAVDAAWLARVGAELPELPMARRERYRDRYGLSAVDAQALTEERAVCLFFEACVAAAGGDGKAGFACGKLLLNAGAKRANERGVRIDQLGITPARVAELVSLREAGTVGPQAADQLFGLLCETDRPAAELAEAHGLVQVRNEGQLDEWVAAAIAAQPQAAADVAAGKTAAVGRLVGHVMKLSGGKADAKSINEKLLARLRGDGA